MSARVRVVTVAAVTRAGSSRFGNPSFVVEFADGTVYRTAPDAQVAFEVEAHVGHRVEAVIERGHLRSLVCSTCTS